MRRVQRTTRVVLGRLSDVVAGILRLVTGLAALVAFVLVCLLLIEAITQDAIVIQPIAVPKTLAENGFTPEVVAERLRDDIAAFVAGADKTMRQRKILDQPDVPDVVVPSIGMSAQTIAAQIRTFLKIEGRQTIGGEFTIVGKRLVLSLRRNSTDISPGETGSPDDPDDLLAKGARQIVKVTQPYIYASSLFASDRAEALRVSQGIIDTFPARDEQVVHAHVLKGDVLAADGRRAEAIAEIESAIAIDPSFSGAYNDLALLYVDMGRYEDARKTYAKALARAPKSDIAHNGMGNALEHLGRHDEAMAEFKRAIELDPTDVYALTNLGTAFEKLGRHQEALAEYDKAIDLDPSAASAHDGRGQTLARLGRPDEAMKEYEKAAALEPKSAQPHYFLGLSLVHANRLAEGKAELDTAVALDPKAAYAHDGLGIALERLGRHQEAVAEFQTAIGFDPDLANSHNDIGDALESLGRHDEASAEYRRAIALDPASAYPHFNLAMLFCRGGHGAEAKAEYRAAEALKPDLTKANPLPPHCPPDRT